MKKYIKPETEVLATATSMILAGSMGSINGEYDGQSLKSKSAFDLDLEDEE